MQNGGLKLRNPTKYQGSIGFDPIIEMINNQGSELKLLNYTSAKGIMFILNVSKGVSEYLGLNDNYKFEEPVTCFVLKLVIISDRDEQLPPYKDTKYRASNTKTYPKSTETEKSFYDECKLQETVWERSITGRREPICLSVANLVCFSNEDSKQVLDFFLKKINPSSNLTTIKSVESERIINFLFNEIRCNQNYKLSIMTMPAVRGSTTLDDIVPNAQATYTDATTYANARTTYTNAMIYAVAQIIRLFLELHIFHLDLHSRNILIYTKDRRVKCVLIDFGRASILNDDVSNEYIRDTQVKNTYSEEAEKYYEDFFRILRGEEPPPEEKKDFVENVIKSICNIDDTVGHQNFNLPTGEYQLDWINDLNRYNYEAVFDTMRQIMITEQPDKLTPSTINRYKINRLLINFDEKENLNDFLTTFNHSDSSSTSSSVLGVWDQSNVKRVQDSDYCTISGGKSKRYRKSRKGKRYRKSRKSKRSRKSRK